MALFGKKKKEEEKVEATPEAAEVSKSNQQPKIDEKADVQVSAPGRDLASIILRPRITEKAVLGTDRNIYTFEVRKDATKHDVRDAVREVYKVTPQKINIVNKKPRHYTSRLRGRAMMEKGVKKAYVYLKEGDRIDLV